MQQPGNTTILIADLMDGQSFGMKVRRGSECITWKQLMSQKRIEG